MQPGAWYILQHPFNGGAFFWAADNDTNGACSASVGSVMQPSSGFSKNPKSYPKNPPSGKGRIGWAKRTTSKGVAAKVNLQGGTRRRPSLESGTDADYCDLEQCCQNKCWGDVLGPTSAPIFWLEPTPAPAVRPAPAPTPVPTPTLLVSSQPTSCSNTDKSGQWGGCGPGRPCADSSKCCS